MALVSVGLTFAVPGTMNIGASLSTFGLKQAESPGTWLKFLSLLQASRTGQTKEESPLKNLTPSYF